MTSEMKKMISKNYKLTKILFRQSKETDKT